MHISASFDSGNIEVVSSDRPSDIRLRIRSDAGGEHMQWFHFRLTGGQGKPCTLRIENAHAVSYPKAWTHYRAVASYDRQHWFRVPTQFQEGQLIIEHTPSHDVVYYAYFAPYSLERHHDLLARMQLREGVSLLCLGTTVDGRDLDMLQVGTPGPGLRTLWCIARQHPGETMAEWWMEGFIDALTDPNNALARAIRDQAVVYVIPNMNPDGSIRGHLRCNAAGANLNREWHEPCPERSPEVWLTRNAMDARGCDFCLDVHGDEELPYNFIAAAEGIPSWTDRLAHLTQQFKDALEQANPDFQQVHGYPDDAPGQANMSMCTSQIAERFDCLAMTLEQPFKDNANRPHITEGWSPERARQLGASTLHAIATVLPQLRE